MKKRTVLTVLLVMTAFNAAYAQTTIQRSLYVSAQGDDNNNGRSETTPFKTLEKAVEAANAGVIKTITVIGTINGTFRNISIYQSGNDEILITGKPNANEAERAVINGIVGVGGKVKVRFTHIRLVQVVGDRHEGTITLGAGVVVSDSGYKGDNVWPVVTVDRINIIMTDDATITGCSKSAVMCYEIKMSGNASITNNNGGVSANIVTMSGNAKVSNNKGSGVKCSTLTMSENAEISGNVNNRDGGGGASVENLIMSGNAKIINNTAKGNGGGVYVYRSTLTISGNALISGNTAKNGGGIYSAQGNTSTLTMESGEISNNKAEYGAGVYIEEGYTFNHKGGTITGNNAEFIGGGIYVRRGATYTAGGGKISANTSGDMGDDNIFRQQ